MELKIGLIGFGEVNTPREFIVNRVNTAVKTLKDAQLDICPTSIVSDDPDGLQAQNAVDELKKIAPDMLIVCVAGWIPSWAVFRVIEPFKHLPMLLLGLTGWEEQGRYVTTADQAGTTALRYPMEVAGYNFKYIVNRMRKPLPVNEIKDFAQAVFAVKKLKTTRIGMAGYRDMRLYGTMYDGLLLKKVLGVEIEHFETMELEKLMQDAEVGDYPAQLRENWNFVRDPKPGTLENTVKMYLAIRKKIESAKYDGFSFNDVDGIKKLFGFAPAGALTLLHDTMDICTVPENDAPGCVTEQIMRYLSNQTAAYLEFYEFTEDGALMGVPDYVPKSMVDGKITVMPNAFGDFGEGLLNVSKLKTGTVTLARLGQYDGTLCIHAATGKAVTPPKWEEAGWAPPAPQLPSLEIKFDEPVEPFINNVLGQHYIIVYGDVMDKLIDFCALTGINIIIN